jgi:hypothetical protein
MNTMRVIEIRPKRVEAGITDEGLILDMECPYREGKSCGEWCAHFEVRPPNADHARLRAHLWCGNRTMNIHEVHP